MINRNNSSKPIKKFCFQKEEHFRNESVLYAGNASFSHCNMFKCYTISEASNEVVMKSQDEFPVHDVSIESIFETSKNIFLLHLKSPKEEQIRQFSLIPPGTVLQKNTVVFQTNNPNSRISFFFPMPDKSNSTYQTIYSVENKLFKQLGNVTEEINLPIKNPSLNCGAYIDNNTFALGIGPDLLLYDIRAKNSKNERTMHSGDISTISVNRLDTNILYTGGVDGFVKQIDIRNWADSKEKAKCVHEVHTGHHSLPQCPVIHIAPNHVDKSVFATASSGNALYGYIRIFKDGATKYYSKTDEPQKSKQSQEEAFISATTQNKVTWIDWSYTDPSLLVSVDMNGKFRTHYFTDLDFDGMLSGL